MGKEDIMDMEKKHAYLREYMKTQRKVIGLNVPIELEKKYRAEAEKRGMSLRAFIIECVEKEIGECD